MQMVGKIQQQENFRSSTDSSHDICYATYNDPNIN